MKRTFIAFDIIPSETVKEVFETVRHRLRNERITWIDPGNLHITVKFLGDTDDALIPEIISCANRITVAYEPFRLNLKGLGVFRNIHDPNVLWMGCRIEDSLAKLKNELELSLNSLGFETETRVFSPHLTLGRIKLLRQTNQLGELLTAYKDREFQEMMIHELVYYESRLTPLGSVYTQLQRFTIGPSRS